MLYITAIRIFMNTNATDFMYPGIHRVVGRGISDAVSLICDGAGYHLFSE